MRRNVVGAYVLHLLREQCFDAGGDPIRGKQAEIRKATGFTSAHVTHIFARAREGRGSGRGVGDDFAHALAEKWFRITYAELEARAVAWEATQPAEERRRDEHEPPYWRRDPGWAEALSAAKDEAQRRGLRIPDRYFFEAGEAVVPGRSPTAEGVIRLAELLWVTDRG